FREHVEELYGVFFNRNHVSKIDMNPYELFEIVQKRLVETINKFSSGASTDSHNFLLLQLTVLLDRTDPRDPQGVSAAVQSLWANQERVVDRINQISAKPAENRPKSKSVLEKFNIEGIPTVEQFERLVGKGVDFLKRGLQPLQERGVLKQIMKITQETVQRAKESGQLTRGTLETAQLLMRFCKNLRGSHAECSLKLKERIFLDIDEILREIKELSDRVNGPSQTVKPLGATSEPLPDHHLAGVTAFFDKKVTERAPSLQNIPVIVDEILTLLELYKPPKLDAMEQGKIISQLQQQAESFDLVTRVVEMSVPEVLPATMKLVQILRSLPKSKASWDLDAIRAQIMPLAPEIKQNYQEHFGGANDNV
ncbi:MAG: hypothetical protein P1V97_19170, partial [Planctomycetota bacterium]|nr:hypothetical protein [Planctomycetota bacterium]